MSKQPEALRLADEIEGSVNNPQLYWQGKAAVELRRLHALNAELLEALKKMLGQASNIECLGEWSALEINHGQAKRFRALVDADIALARAVIAKATGAAS